MAATEMAPGGAEVQGTPGLGLVLVDRDSGVTRPVADAVSGTRFSLVSVVEDAEALMGEPSEAALVLVVADLSPFARPSDLLVVCGTTTQPVVAVMVSGGPGAIRRAVAAGAAGVVDARSLDTALIPCLEAALSGQVCVPMQRGCELAAPVLSHREKQVLELVAAGLTNAEVADRLYLAESTVKSHLSSTFRKLGVRSRAEAAAMALNPTVRAELGMSALSVDDELQALASGA